MKILFFILGLISFIMGIIGIFFPILPTTPFLLLASFCFLRSFEKINRYFENTKFYKKYLKDIKEGKGISNRKKIIILLIATVMIAIAFYFANNSVVRIILVVLLIAKYIFFIKWRS